MLRKVLQGVSGLMLVGGFIFAVSTAGDYELDIITTKYMFIRCGIASLVGTIGYIGLRLTNWKYLN